MKGNGFEVNITESEFKAKSQDDKIWLLFQGIVSANKGIVDINSHGCEFAKDKYRESWRWTLSSVVGAIVFALSLAYLVAKLLTCK